VEAKIQKTYDLNLSLMAIKCNRPQVSSNTPLKKLVIKLTVFSSRKKVTMLKELKTELLSTLYQIPPLEELGKSLEVQTFVPIMRHIEPQLHFFQPHSHCSSSLGSMMLVGRTRLFWLCHVRF
jgi:hypothetical protein